VWDRNDPGRRGGIGVAFGNTAASVRSRTTSGEAASRATGVGAWVRIASAVAWFASDSPLVRVGAASGAWVPGEAAQAVSRISPTNAPAPGQRLFELSLRMCSLGPYYRQAVCST
jgi:hypothetical protein